MANCYKCEKELTADEIGLFRKTVDRMADRFLCIDCLAEHFDTTSESLYEMIKRLRSTGCMLFPK